MVVCYVLIKLKLNTNTQNYQTINFNMVFDAISKKIKIIN